MAHETSTYHDRRVADPATAQYYNQDFW